MWGAGGDGNDYTNGGAGGFASYIIENPVKSDIYFISIGMPSVGGKGMDGGGNGGGKTVLSNNDGILAVAGGGGGGGGAGLNTGYSQSPIVKRGTHDGPMANSTDFTPINGGRGGGGYHDGEIGSGGEGINDGDSGTEFGGGNGASSDTPGIGGGGGGGDGLGGGGGGGSYEQQIYTGDNHGGGSGGGGGNFTSNGKINPSFNGNFKDRWHIPYNYDYKYKQFDYMLSRRGYGGVNGDGHMGCAIILYEY